MFRYLRRILLVALLFFLFSRSVFAAESIPAFTGDVTIHQNGAVTIRETIVYDFGTEDRHGIIRDIPVVYENFEGKKFEAGFDLVSITDTNSASYQFQESREGENIRIRIADPDRTVTGINTYVLTYVLGGVIQQYSDHDELLLDVTGHGWSVPMSQPVATIAFAPEVAVDSSAVNTICFTGSYGSKEQN